MTAIPSRAGFWTVALVLVVAGWFGLVAARPETVTQLSFNLSRYGWFIDLSAILAAGEARQMGLSPYEPNPLDLFNRPHSYPSSWLALGDLGLTRADTLWLGTTLVIVFFLSAIVFLRPRNAVEWAVCVLVLLSPTVQLGVVRGNNDLVIFLVLFPLAWCLARSERAARFCATIPIAIATALKYYPAAAALLLIAEKDRRLGGWRLAGMLVLFGLVGWNIYEDSRHFAATLPSPNGLYVFGAARIGHGQLLPMSAVLGLGLAVVLLGIMTSPRRSATSPMEVDRDTFSFMLGSVLLTSCFWVAMNWGYRWIFCIWMLPLLLRGSKSGFVLRSWELRVVGGLMIFCLWLDGGASFLWFHGGAASFNFDKDSYLEFSVRWLTLGHWLFFGLLTFACARFAWYWLARWLRPAALESAPAL